MLDQPHGIAVDSKGNVYVSENRGRRIQKFKPVSQ
ncbi:MAG: SBBP repeat-containing protein [Acidobacteriota bacterium]|nr:SBBP repeat-containing protein [Acidobacteriota bacterium]